MSFRGMRRALAAEPRWIVAILLAFAIQMVPAAAVVSHRHAEGDVAHSHVGPIHGAGAAAVRPHADGLTRAPARDLHQHVSHPVVVTAGPDVADATPALFTARVVALPPLGVRSAVPRAGLARAPPPLAA